jgi:SPX domain protein involved in polyphosphate accumulation
MKFGEYLQQHQVSEWKDFYINYNLLKQIIKKLEKKYKQCSTIKNKNSQMEKFRR